MVQPANPLPPPAPDSSADDLVLIEAPASAPEPLSVASAPMWPPPIEEQEQVEFFELGETLTGPDVAGARAMAIVPPPDSATERPDHAQPFSEWDEQQPAPQLHDQHDAAAASPWGAPEATASTLSEAEFAQTATGVAARAESLNQQVKSILARVGRWSGRGQSSAPPTPAAPPAPGWEQPPDHAGWDVAASVGATPPAFDDTGRAPESAPTEVAAADRLEPAREDGTTSPGERRRAEWTRTIAASVAVLIGGGALWLLWTHPIAGDAADTAVPAVSRQEAAPAPPADSPDTAAANAAPPPPPGPSSVRGTASAGSAPADVPRAGVASAAAVPAGAPAASAARTAGVPGGGASRSAAVPAASAARAAAATPAGAPLAAGAEASAPRGAPGFPQGRTSRTATVVAPVSSAVVSSPAAAVVPAGAVSQARAGQPSFTVRGAAADTGPEAIQGIQAAVLRTLDSYRQAYAGLDAGEAARIWPDTDAAALRRAFGEMQSLSLAFDRCDLAVEPTWAIATCRGQTREPVRGQPGAPQVRVRTWVLTLASGPGGWTTEHTEVN
jgi:hypothetical protein